MTDTELFALDEMGLIPGPNESEQAFSLRVRRTQKKFEEGDWIPQSHWDFTREFLYEFANVKPLYICVFYSNSRLAPWQGAACWIEGTELHAVQLRKKLATGSYLGRYSREEILAHEAIHAVRSAFHSRFDEFFAYMTSEKRWRRALGPILQRPWEAWPFFLSLLAATFHPGWYLFASLWAGWGFIRLFRNHRMLAKASNHIYAETGNKHLARAILFRLSDEEVGEVARGKTIANYLKTSHDLRWKIIRNFYGKKDCDRTEGMGKAGK